jgi:hypothetical protein
MDTNEQGVTKMFLQAAFLVYLDTMSSWPPQGTLQGLVAEQAAQSLGQ